MGDGVHCNGDAVNYVVRLNEAFQGAVAFAVTELDRRWGLLRELRDLHSELIRDKAIAHEAYRIHEENKRSPNP